MLWSTAEIDNESHEQQTNHCDDFETGEDEFGFTVDLDGEDVQAEYEKDEEGNPYSHRNVVCAMPVLDDDRCCRDLGAEGDRRGVPVLFEGPSQPIVLSLPSLKLSRWRYWRTKLAAM